MSAQTTSSPHGDALLALYDDALPEVYGYLLARCRQRTVAEELTSEVFMAAVDSIRRAAVTDVTIAWLVGVARHKLLDHWRREERETRRLTAVAGQTLESDDPWDVKLDVLVARDVLAVLSPSQRGALTLRYLDDCPSLELPRSSGAPCMPPRPCWCEHATRSDRPTKRRTGDE